LPHAAARVASTARIEKASARVKSRIMKELVFGTITAIAATATITNTTLRG